jgi:tetratricopeptide (TPR) repeat protein
MTPFELLLAKKYGATVATKMVTRIWQLPFRRHYVAIVSRQTKLSTVEKHNLRVELKDESVYLHLFAPRAAAIAPLTAIVSPLLLPGDRSDNEIRARAKEVAQILHTCLFQALDTSRGHAGLAWKLDELSEAFDRNNGTIIEALGESESKILAAISDTSASPEGWVLLAGPLNALKLDNIRERARNLAGTDPTEAAALLTQIVDRLTEAGYAALTTPIEIERAAVLSSSDDLLAAAEAWTDLVVRELESGGRFNAMEGLDVLARLAQDADAPAWLKLRTAALSEIYWWYHAPSADTTSIVAAAAECARAGDPRALTILTLACETTLDEYNNVALSAIPAEATELLPGVALDLTQARFACAMADQPGAAWPTWAQLHALATGSACNPAIAGLILARAARAKYLHGDLASAEQDYRLAVGQGCLAGKWEDAADWSQSAGRMSVGASGIGQLTGYADSASALRAAGRGRLLPSAFDPHLAALEELDAGRPNQALPHLRRMLRESCVIGDLEGERIAHRLLGKVYADTEIEPQLTLTNYVRAGYIDEAESYAASLRHYEDVSSLAHSPVRETRAVVLRIATSQADLIPDTEVVDWFDLAKSEIDNAHPTWIGPQPWAEAYKLVAALASRLSNGQIEAMFGTIDQLLDRDPSRASSVDSAVVDLLASATTTHPDLAPAVGRRILKMMETAPHMTSRLLGRSGAVELCMPAMRPDLVRLRDLGNGSAAEFLSLYDDDVEAARRTVAAEFASSPGYQVNAGTKSMAFPGPSIGIAAYQARLLESAERSDLATFYLDRALDGENSDLNRAAYVDGLRVLSAGLDPAARRVSFDRLVDIANVDIADDLFAPGELHPLGNMQFNFPIGELRRSAVRALCELADDDDQRVQAAHAVQLLLSKATDADAAAVAQCCVSLARADRELPIDWVGLATSPSRVMRQAAAALAATHSGNRSLVLTLASDSDTQVRVLLASVCPALANLEPTLAATVLGTLTRDPSYRVRQAAASAAAAV